MTPLISVIVPVYNVQEHVAACLHSLKGQILEDFEVILVNDGSQDDSRARALEAIGDDPRFYILDQENQGLSGARNTGLAHAKGAFIAFVDSDDRVAPDYLQELWQALEESGADWVACAVRYCHGPSESICHSAIHGTPALHSSGRITRYDFGCWSDVIPHFPSAWNKLYRRRLIDGLRFPEGTWFEDHGFYIRAAARTDHILHIAKPLYWQTLDREGRITSSDSERVFEQFDVLDDVKTVLSTPVFSGGAEAFEQLTARLIYERSTALQDPDRRARYVIASKDYLARHGLTYRANWAFGVSAAWELEMESILPLSIVLLWPKDASAQKVRDSLESLRQPATPAHEVFIICQSTAHAKEAAALAEADPAITVTGPTTSAALRAAKGQYVLFLSAGDRLIETSLQHGLNSMITGQADILISAYQYRDGRYHTGVHDPEALSPSQMAAAPFSLTPQEALLVDGYLSSKLYRRAFLDAHDLGELQAPLAPEALAFRAALAAQTVVYLPVASCITSYEEGTRHARRLSPPQIAKAVRRLARELPPTQRAALPSGWQRRLFGRAVWHQWHFAAPARPRPLQAAFASGAAGLSLWYGWSDPTGALDPQLGPKTQRLLNAGRRSLTELPPPGDTASGPVNRGFHVTGFSAHSKARLRYTVDFTAQGFANISFYDRAKWQILFHLSLRKDASLAVCNARLNGEWRRETRRKLTFQAAENTVEIRFDAPHITVLINNRQAFRFGAPHQRRFPHLDRIRSFDFQGGLVPSSVDIDIGTRDPHGAPGQLSFNSRLELRGFVHADTPDTPLTLRLRHNDMEIPVITRPEPQAGHGWRLSLRALLPGRVWQDLPPSEPLEAQLLHGVTSYPPFTLTREMMAEQIEQACEENDPTTDALAGMQILEHVRFGQLTDRLGPLRQRLLEIQYAFGLDGFLPDEDSPDQLPPALPPEADPLTEATARFHQTMRRAPALDPLAVLRETDVPKPLRPYLYLRLSEFFCLSATGFEAAYHAYAQDGLIRALNLREEDIWHNTALLPFLVMEQRFEEVVTALEPLGAYTEQWIVTPALAWTVKKTLHNPDVPEPLQYDILDGVLACLKKQAQDYWGRAKCVELTRMAVWLLDQLEPLPSDRADKLTRTLLQVYGLSQQFWAQVAQDHPALPSLAAEAATHFTVIAGASSDQDGPALEAALRWFEPLEPFDAPLLRRDLLGPSGMYSAKGRAPDLERLITTSPNPKEAVLRHMAFPQTAQTDPAYTAFMAKALPAFYPEIPTAPAYEAQVALGRALQGLPAQDLPELDAALEQMTELAGAESQHLGLALMMLLLHQLEDPAKTHAVEARLRQAMAGQTPAQVIKSAAPYHMLQTLRQDGFDALDSLFPMLPSLPSPAPAVPARFEKSPLFDTVVTVFSCLPNLETRIPAMRASWLGLLEEMGIPCLIIVGNGDGRVVGDVVHVDAPDDYEGLPQKTLAAVQWVHDNTDFAHMLKIDDDCFLNPAAFFQSLSYRKFDYYGRTLERRSGQMDRAWHNAKSTTPRGRLELDKSPEPSTYTDGGSGYTLSRRAMAAILKGAESPSGQYLRQVSFMEDKLVGDLLALSGIQPEREDYRIAIRRRTHASAHPVSLWVNSFDASRAAPVKLVHLDGHATQAAALEGLSAPNLSPKKIWPSYQNAVLGYQSNALELISPQSRLDAARDAEVAVIACLRNEMFLLPHFLNHYRALGVKSFLMADNCSDDGSLEYLMDQPDVALFSVDTDYNRSFYGVAWQQALLSAFRVGKWSLMADVDEFLIWQQTQTQTLPELLSGPDFAEADAVRLFMLDLYPKGPLSEARFESSPFAEAAYAERDPFLLDWGGRGPFSNMPTWTSALRHRLIQGARSDLFVAQKIALLRYQPWMRVSPGLHFVTDIKLAAPELLFAHFKYHAAFWHKAQTEVARGQHFNNAEEYRKYLALLSEGRDQIYDPKYSMLWHDVPFIQARLR